MPSVKPKPNSLMSSINLSSSEALYLTICTTGPKAGGPEYLKRLCYEQSISNNTAAMGGNASLLAEVDD